MSIVWLVVVGLVCGCLEAAALVALDGYLKRERWPR